MRTRGSSRLSNNTRKELILDLCQAISTLNSPKEVAELLTDLLTAKETETIAKRLQIADYLAKGHEYDYIRDQLRVGYSTISRVNTWLNLSGDGFKNVLSKKKPQKTKTTNIAERYDPYSWHNIKRRYSMYFWPQLLLEELLNSSNNTERDKIYAILDKLEMKKHEFKAENNKQLYEMFSKKKLPGG